MNAHVEPANISFTPSEHAPFLKTAMVDIGNGIELCVEVGGNPKNPPLLLIMGLGAQMIYWPEDFMEKLINSGYYVIRYDNRDIGLSTKVSPVLDKNGKVIRANIIRLLRRITLGKPSPNEPVPYRLNDMAEDASNLISSLGLSSAHIIGASMGGMIAQILAADHPEKVRSLGLLYTTNNQPLLPPPYPKQLKALLLKPRKEDTETLVAHGVKVFQAIGSPGHVDKTEADSFTRKLLNRSYYPVGFIHQLLAIISTGSLIKYNKRTKKPTVVVHGSADRLLHPARGRAVARAIKGASYHEVEGFGHDVAPAFQKQLVSIFTSLFNEVEAKTQRQVYQTPKHRLSRLIKLPKGLRKLS